MMRNLLLTALLFTGISVFSQSFTAMYPFSSVMSGTASTGTTDPTPPPTATGVTFGSWMAVGTGTNPSTGGVFSFNGWDVTITNGNDAYATYTGAINPGKYYEVTITPNSGYAVDLTSITFNMLRSSTGPRNWAVRSNKDGYTNNLPASVVSNTAISTVAGDVFFWNFDATSNTVQQKGSMINLSGTNFTSQTTPYTFRLYAWNSENTAGTFRIDTVTFTGLATAGAGLAEYTQDINSAIRIYPNPSNDGIVYLDPKKINYSKVEVINILGSVVATENKEINSSEKLKLNLNTLPSGTYFVRVTSGNKVYTERFFISK
jgi:hypothetical protein